MITRIKTELRDWARYSPLTRGTASRLVELRAEFGRPRGRDADGTAEYLAKLTLAARGSQSAGQLNRLEQRITDAVSTWDAAAINWNSFYPLSEPRLVQKALILKPPATGGEKGVLFVAFEDNWLRVLRYAHLEKLARDYDLVISPTWSPPHDLALLLAGRLWPAPLYTILSNFNDEGAFSRLVPGIRTIPLLASSWVNPDSFNPPDNRDYHYDIFMLANFASYKRHFALFRLLAQMPPRYRAALAGRSWEGRTRATLEAEAQMYGVRDRIEILEGLDDDAMIAAMHSSRTSVIMSLGEGACVAVAESLFADVPVALIEGANIGSSAFINERTGALLRPWRLAGDMAALIERAPAMHPRQWMLETGRGYAESSRLLNDSLREWGVGDGRPWTRDLVAMQWRPNAEFGRRSEGEELLTEYRAFEERYGIEVQLPPSLRQG